MSRLHTYLKKTAKPNTATTAYLAALDHITTVSPKIAEAICDELRDQRSHLKLIASENYSSLAVQLAMGNLLTDKYAEGYVEHRFYAGCEHVDAVEKEAEEQLKKLFGAEYAYVQPHSGADANLVAIWSILIQNVQNKELAKLGDKKLDELTEAEHEKIRQLIVNQKLMGMSLNSGGHLTHGYRHNVSSKIMRSFPYDVDPKTELLCYDTLAKQVREVKPLILLAGYSSYPRRIDFAKMREIADSVGAVLMSDIAHFAGLVAGKAFLGSADPVSYSHMVTSTTHKTLRGPRGGIIMCKKEYQDTVQKGCPLVLGGPLPHVIAAKAIAFKEANTPEFCTYAHKILENAKTLADELLKRGCRLVTNGTDNHLLILDVSPYGLTGRHAENALRAAGLTVNRNAIPFDKNGPWYTSGIRIGTPAVTTLGMGPDEMRLIADILIDVLQHTSPETNTKTGQSSKAKCKVDPIQLSKTQGRVAELLSKHPLYPEIELD